MSFGKKLNATLRTFIERQPMFFVATAATDGRVNVSPKGMDTLRIVDDNHIRWLNLSGSGNETAAHVQATGRMTLMFCAFEGDAMILRTFGTAKVIHPRDPTWADCVTDFPDIAGSRQIFDLTVDMIRISCGTGVPYMDLKSERGKTEMEPFYRNMGEDGVKDYWAKKNAMTIDGAPTGILDDL